MSGILVVLEQRAGKIARINWEALSAAQRLGRQLPSPPPSSGRKMKQPQPKSPPALPAKSSALSTRSWLPTQPTAHPFLQQLIHSENPTHVVFPHTYQVRDFAQRSPLVLVRYSSAMSSPLPPNLKRMPHLHPPTDARPPYRQLLPRWQWPCFVSVQAGAFPSIPRQLHASPDRHIHSHPRRRPNPHPPSESFRAARRPSISPPRKSSSA